MKSNETTNFVLMKQWHLKMRTANFTKKILGQWSHDSLDVSLKVY